MVGPRRTCADRRRRHPQAARPQDPRAGRVDGRARAGAPAPDPLDPLAGGEATRRSIWPAIYPELLELVREHRSTIVFVNNRRGAERLALRLNELAEEDIARAHHGSLAREERTVVEEMLKAGELPCLVATSSLELGIDMGAVDLVLQVESPKSVARGLQRIGRAGHARRRHRARAASSPSSAPTCSSARSSSSSCARAASSRPSCRATRSTCSPSRSSRSPPAPSPSAVGVDDALRARHAHALLRRAAARRCSRTCSTCSTAATRRRSSASCARASCGTASAGTIRARKGARQLAVTNAGTIPDRGLFSVTLPDGRRVGELDEEMVYEARAGPDLPARRLDVAHRGDRPRPRDRHARARRARAPCRSGRATASGARRSSASEIGAFSALGRRPARRGARARLRPRRARRAQPRSTSCASSRTPRASCPSDRTIVVERFRDEIGDWRLCVLSPYGGRVHAAWGLALSARASATSYGLESDAIWSDDGIIVHLPDADEPPGAELVLLDPDEVEDAVVAELGAQRAVRRALPRERRAARC